MREMMIRDAGESDIEALANLMTELGYPTSTEDMSRRFEEISADPSYDTLIAERTDEIIGMAGLHIERFYEKNKPCARLMALVVDSEHRGLGVGRTLISAVEVRARQRGAGEVMLTTHKRRADAHRLYRSVGYEATGYRFYKEL
jgi:N-acetylglutamate synthase-like GNAT family acetyltransferase